MSCHKYFIINQLFLLVTVVLLLLSCQNRNYVEHDEPETHELLTVTAQDYIINAEYPASIQGDQDIKIIPRVEGYLQGVYVKEGATVKAGQLLFRIDDATYRAAVESANANVQMMTAALNKSQLEYEGKKELHGKSIISDFELSLSESDLGMAKANLAAAKAALSSARNDLSYTEIRSPSNGVVGRIPYRKGDLVGPSMQDGLTVVADNRQMRVYFSMTENQVMRYISDYQTLSETIEHFPKIQLKLPNGKLYNQPGHIESISGVIDEQTGAVSVCARFDNPNGMLLSGGTGKIVLPTEISDAIVIPQESTYDIQDKVYVVKVVDGKAVSTIIQVENQNDGKNYVITSGLKVGDLIVAKGSSYIKEGTLIKTK
ncbi:MAG: efflux RND transporter periplasmic adaptor subunit [Bacteroidales bacterium]|nr:efflux RND transporter periplasmic adaptor subunit [Bacteroidales bacterium]